MRANLRVKAIVLIALVHTAGISAQTPAPSAISLPDAVRFALARHPQVSAASTRLDAARAARDAAVAGLLPSLDISGQLNRSTANAVAASFFALPGVPATSGPVGTTVGTGVSASTLALSATIPLTGTWRNDRVAGARGASVRAAEAGNTATQVDVAYGAAAAWIRAAGARATHRAAEANLARAQALLGVTRPLVTQQLRPGADLARAQAEVAAAQIDVARASRERDVADALLAAAIGSDAPVSAADAAIAPPAPITSPGNANPAVVDARETLDAANRERNAAALALLPRVDVVGAYWGRGSGIPINGSVASYMHDGLYPGVKNWAVGLLVSWPILGLPGIEADIRRADATAAAAAARVRATDQAYAAARRAAEADTAGAAAIATRTAEALGAAHVALDQATARYASGLSSVAEVADAQRLMARAEAADAVAGYDVKLSRLALARAIGDLGLLLAEAGAGGAR